MAKAKRTADPKPALRRFRRLRKLDPAKAGRLVKISGFTWKAYETGWRQMSGDMCKRFEEKLGIPRAEIRPDLFELQAT